MTQDHKTDAIKMKTRTPIYATAGSLAVALALSAATLSRTTADAGSEEANITRATVKLLEHSQFARHRLDAELSGKFLDRYLDALDGEHVLFLQSDLNEFDRYRSNLADLTRRAGDTSPAHNIYARYLERLAQREAYVTNLLHTTTFDFTGHDRWETDRRNAARPVNLTAAQVLWRQQVRAAYLQEELGGQPTTNIAKTLSRRYARTFQTMQKLSSDEVLEVYLDALAHVYDPHSDYLGREQLENFNIAMNLSLFGIGATLQSQDGYCTIRELLPGGPAARSGSIKPGDRIVAVAQGHQDPVDVVDMPLSQAVELVRGPKDTTVRLTIIPVGADSSARKTVSLVRDEIKLEDQRAKASIVDLPEANGSSLRIGMIDLPSFYGMTGEAGASSASADVTKLLHKLNREHMQGLILDLRRNGGGSLEEAIRLTGLFIPKGPIVQTRDPNGDVDVEKDPDPRVLYNGPMIVLTSRFSASASEILAGALQDYGRALIVGDSSTFGKGTVQNLVSLAAIFDRNGLPHEQNPGAVKVTIRKFYRPGGASTQLRGVTPDLILPSSTDLKEISERKMSEPLPWDSVPASRFSKLNRVRPVLATLQRESATRVANDPALRLLRQNLALASEKLEGTSISLNEAERRRDKAQADALEAKLKTATQARAGQTPTTYDITLQNADLPSLPAARKPSVAKTATTQLPSSNEQMTPSSVSTADTGVDIVLREAEHILADYIQLSPRTEPLTQFHPAGHPASRPL
jgi:carboxyl-terminal processing protease